MDYKERKRELTLKRDEILRNFEILSSDTFKVASEMGKVFDECTNENDKLDWMSFIADTEATRKFTRLVSALLYVTRPQDKQIIEDLKENIEINTKRKK